MATGCSDINTVGHDEVFEWNCSHCEEKGSFVEAVVFCVVCGELYCEACREGHASFPALRGHKLLGTDKQELWGGKEKPEKRPDECEVHEDQKRTMYCGAHDVTCCPVCASLDHRSCGGVVFIPQASKGIEDSRQWKNFLAEIADTVAFLGKIKTKKVNCRAQIADYKSSIVSGIEERRRKVNELFDQLQEATQRSMDDFHRTTLEKQQRDIEVCDTVQQSLKSSKQNLVEDETLVDETEKFLSLKQCHRHVKAIMKTLPGDIAQMPSNQTLDIKINPELDKIVEMFIKSLKPNNCVAFSSYTYTVRSSRTVTIRLVDDEGPCGVTDMCVMPNGSLLLADSNNRCVKALDESGEVSGQCGVAARPRGLCCVDGRTAVAALNARSLAFLSTDPDLAVVSTVALSHECYGVAHWADRLYVSDGATRVYVYCSACSPLASVDMYATYFSCFQQARLMAVSADGSRLHVADASLGLVTVDTSGKHLSTTSPAELQGPAGVCLDAQGSVLISGTQSGNILQVSRSGDEVADTIDCSDHLTSPTSLAFSGSSLYVGSLDDCNSLTVLELQLK